MDEEAKEGKRELERFLEERKYFSKGEKNTPKWNTIQKMLKGYTDDELKLINDEELQQINEEVDFQKNDDKWPSFRKALYMQQLKESSDNE